MFQLQLPLNRFDLELLRRLAGMNDAAVLSFCREKLMSLLDAPTRIRFQQYTLEEIINELEV